MVLLEPPFHAKRHPRPAMVSAIAGARSWARSDDGGRRAPLPAMGSGPPRRQLRPRRDARPLARPGDAAAVVHELAAGTGEHLDADRLGRIAAPVRLLCGDRSQTVFAEAGRRATSAIPGAALIDVIGSGHAIQLAAPQLVADSVIDVSRQRSSSAHTGRR